MIVFLFALYLHNIVQIIKVKVWLADYLFYLDAREIFIYMNKFRWL